MEREARGNWVRGHGLHSLDLFPCGNYRKRAASGTIAALAQG